MEGPHARRLYRLGISRWPGQAEGEGRSRPPPAHRADDVADAERDAPAGCVEPTRAAFRSTARRSCPLRHARPAGWNACARAARSSRSRCTRNARHRIANGRDAFVAANRRHDDSARDDYAHPCAATKEEAAPEPVRREIIDVG